MTRDLRAAPAVPRALAEERRSVLIFGPPRTAVSGVTTHVNQLLASSLHDSFDLDYFEVGRAEGEPAARTIVRLLSSPVALAVKIVARRPHIVHLNSSMNFRGFWRDSVYLLIAKLLGRRVVYHIQGGQSPQDFCRRRRFLERFFKGIMRLPDAVVVLREGRAAELRAFIPQIDLRVIPNAVDLAQFRGRRGTRADRRSVELVYMGRLVHDKGVQDCIDAVALLAETGLDDVRLTIAGTGPERDALEARVRALGIAQCVEFAGAVFGEQKRRLWERADLFVFPTFWAEGLPFALLESLASGTPVITTRCAAIPDVIEDGVHGLFVAPHDAPAIADAVRRLVSDRSLLGRVSEACTERASSRYGLDRIVPQLRELYEDLARRA